MQSDQFKLSSSWADSSGSFFARVSTFDSIHTTASPRIQPLSLCKEAITIVNEGRDTEIEHELSFVG